MDKFTVDRANGNGDLTYPIGMLTADEIVMAESGYLMMAVINGQWSLSPVTFGSSNTGSGFAWVYKYYLAGLSSSDIDESSRIGARPSVSLGSWATITEGDGSFQSPYRIS